MNAHKNLLQHQSIKQHNSQTCSGGLRVENWINNYDKTQQNVSRQVMWYQWVQVSFASRHTDN